MPPQAANAASGRGQKKVNYLPCNSSDFAYYLPRKPGRGVKPLLPKPGCTDAGVAQG
jgi:hypothetical protein